MLDYDHCRPEKWNILLALPRRCVHFFYLCFCIRVTQDSDMQFLRLSVGAVSPWEEVMLKYQVLSQMQGVLLNAILAVFTFPVGKGFADEWCPVFFPLTLTLSSAVLFSLNQNFTQSHSSSCAHSYTCFAAPLRLCSYIHKENIHKASSTSALICPPCSYKHNYWAALAVKGPGQLQSQVYQISLSSP